MLYLIGLGLWNERDLTMHAVSVANECSKVYIENYTSQLMGSDLQKLEKALGKEVIPLKREDVEGNAHFVDEAKDNDIALLIGGDPLSATTHSDLVIRAREKGVAVGIVHNASVFSAIAETGLQLYKFGRTATVVYWEENYKPTSFYDAVKENDEHGLHTMLLLDIRPEKKMTPNEALETLIKIDPAFAEREVVVASRLGSPDRGIVFGKAKDLMDKEFGGPMHALVVVGELHDMETAFLEAFK